MPIEKFKKPKNDTQGKGGYFFLIDNKSARNRKVRRKDTQRKGWKGFLIDSHCGGYYNVGTKKEGEVSK